MAKHLGQFQRFHSHKPAATLIDKFHHLYALLEGQAARSI